MVSFLVPFRVFTCNPAVGLSVHLFRTISRVWKPIYAKKRKVFESYTVGEIFI